MLIDTTSRESMERDLAKYLDITVEELLQYIDYAAEKAYQNNFFDTDVFEIEIASIVEDFQPLEHIDNVMCFHLSRRLNNSLDDLCFYNLKDWLLGENSMVKFLYKHDIQFEERDGQLVTYYRGQKLELIDTLRADVCYLRSRFGYNNGRGDFCFNGFAMRDLLMKNQYAKWLEHGPEFLINLSRYLKNDVIVNDFVKESTYFCYKLIIPIEQIIFDGSEELDNEEKEMYLIKRICYRLLMHTDNGKDLSDEGNPIIRVAENAILPAAYVIGNEIITPEMICGKKIQ